MPAFPAMSNASHGTRNGCAPANMARACARGYANGPRLERQAQKTAWLFCELFAAGALRDRKGKTLL